jgi:amidase
LKVDDIDLVHGAPVGVQVITPKLQEEKCISVAKVIEESLAAQRTAERTQQAKL